MKVHTFSATYPIMNKRRALNTKHLLNAIYGVKAQVQQDKQYTYVDITARSFDKLYSAKSRLTNYLGQQL